MASIIDGLKGEPGRSIPVFFGGGGLASCRLSIPRYPVDTCNPDAQVISNRLFGQALLYQFHNLPGLCFGCRFPSCVYMTKILSQGV